MIFSKRNCKKIGAADGIRRFTKKKNSANKVFRMKQTKKNVPSQHCMFVGKVQNRNI